MMKIWETGWDLERRSQPKPRLERPRSELPRGGKDMAAQIGPEMRTVFALPATNVLTNHTDGLLAQLDAWSETLD